MTDELGPARDLQFRVPTGDLKVSYLESREGRSS